MSRLPATWRCRVRAAPRLRRASRPRHRQPCGFHRLAGHECGSALASLGLVASLWVAPTRKGRLFRGARMFTNRCESRCAIQRQGNAATSPLAEQWLLRQLQNPFPLACLGRAHTPGAPHCRGSARPESAPYRVLQLLLFPFVQPRRGVFVCGFRPHSWLGGRRQARRAETEP